MSHSLKNFWDPLFLYRKIMFGLFFFFRPFLAWFLFFFFPRKSLPSLTHSVEKRVFFFPLPEKKKTGFSHTHPIFAEKSKKTNYSREKKKNATFEEINFNFITRAGGCGIKGSVFFFPGNSLFFWVFWWKSSEWVKKAFFFFPVCFFFFRGLQKWVSE